MIQAVFGLLLPLTTHAQSKASDLKKVDTVTAKKADSTGVFTLPNKARSYPILFGQTVSDDDNIGSISFLKGDQLESTPSTFIYTPLTGRMAGLMVSQTSGIPGSDLPSIGSRGNGRTILLDGIDRSMYTINPEQIESVTLLKDAISTVMLGQQSMNGALLFTTKKGTKAKNYFDFNIKAQTGVEAPVTTRQYLNAFDYASLYNEALVNDGRPTLYSAADLDAYKNHTDPYGHPDVNWAAQTIKNNSVYNRYTLNAEGNNKYLSYLVSLDYLDQGGLLNQSDANAYSTNTDYNRYQLRSNINFNATKRLNVYLNLYGAVSTTNGPGGNANSILSALDATPNNAYPIYNPNGSLGGTVDYTNNIWGNIAASGYTQIIQQQVFFDTGFKYNLDDNIKGMWVSGKISYNTNLSQTTDRSKNFDSYSYNVNSTVYSQLTAKTNQANATSSAQNQSLYLEAATGYKRTFGKEGIESMLVAYETTYNNLVSTQLADNSTVYAGNLKFTHDGKYIAQVAASYAGDSYYGAGNGYGFFPAAALGWNVNKEDFMKEIKFINAFKIRGSYGLTGLNEAGYFQNLNTYATGNGYNFNNTAVTGTYLTGIPTMRTYAKALKANIGFDMTFAANRAWVSFDYFNTDASQILLTPRYTSSILGLPYPAVNIGAQQFYGIDLSFGWTDHIGKKFKYDVSANISTSTGKVVDNGEPKLNYPWLQRNGQYTNQIYGYIADGFVKNAGDGPVVAGYKSVRGDIKYKDLDGNGIIDQNDATAIGNNKTQYYYGLNTSFSYGKFYISALIQGVANAQTLINSSTVIPFANNGRGQAYPIDLNRWTPATATTATFPRLSIGNNPNNYVASTFWLRSTAFARLKNMEIGYNLPGDLLGKLKIKNIRLFVNGENLFTITSFKLYDPEMPTANYALQKVINGGISVTF